MILLKISVDILNYIVYSVYQRGGNKYVMYGMCEAYR